MIRYQDALQLLRNLRFDLSLETLPLERCGGRILGRELRARVSSPPYTNSAMDGFAARHAEAVTGTPLMLGETIYARALDAAASKSQAPAYTCARIMTGGCLPEWADTVIPVEQATVDADGRVHFAVVPEKGAHIRREADDIPQDTLLMTPGTLLTPERIMVAAAFGHRELSVRRWPRLAIASTGDELVDPGEPLPRGALYNSSKYFLLTAARQLGLEAEAYPTIPDDPIAAQAALEAIINKEDSATLLLTTGAVSAGEADFIPKLAAQLGFEALLHKVAIRPGKPVFVAKRDHIIWLGLPGNAISTCVGWQIFARPLLAAAAGLPEPIKATVTLANEVNKPAGLRCFFRAELSADRAWVAKRQGSADLAASINHTAYVELPEDVTRFPIDTRVEAFLL